MKATSGPGFAVEDKVAAVAAAAMLASRSPFPQCPGRLVRIEFQVHPDHWDFDDLLLKIERENGSYHAAISVKSQKKITTKKMSADVKDPLAIQFSRISPNPFRRGIDRLALVADRHGDKASAAVHALCTAAAGDAAALARRINEESLFTPAARAIYADLQRHLTRNAVPADAATVLASFDLIEVDMKDYARTEPMAGRQLCAELLHDPSEANISDLWQALVSECQHQKQLPGYLDLERVLAIVRHRFRLKAYPLDAPDWAIIDRESRGQLDLVEDTIAGQVVPREKAQQALRDAIATNVVTAVVGPSGCGKSSLVKQFLIGSGFGVQVWTKASRWPLPKAGILANALGLVGITFDLADIFRRVSAPGILVIDAVEHCVDADRVAQLARVIRLARPDAIDTAWRVVLLVRVEDWSRVREQLVRTSPEITVHTQPLADFEAEDVAVIARAIPGLIPLLRQPRLETVLRKPKVLSLVAAQVKAGGKVEVHDLAGESHLAQWWWRERVRIGENPALRTRALEELVTKQAERVQHAVPESAFETSLLPAFSELSRDDVCVSINQEYAVQHDLYADWARLHILIRQRDQWAAYAAPRLASPQWHRAIRLYGIWLLEQSAAGATTWAKHVREHSEGDVASRLIADLFLEAPLLSAAPAENLRLVWPDLITSGGGLLHRMIERMRHSGTFPHEPLIEIVVQDGGFSRGEAEAHLRIPYPQYWLPLLDVLHEHIEEAAKFAPMAVARVALAWLEFAPLGWAGRKQAAELAVAAARPSITGEHQNTWFSVSAEEDTIYQTLLAAVAECPDDVAHLSRVLAGLLPPTGGTFGGKRWVRIKEGCGPGDGVRYEIPPPWPGGPFVRPKARFQRLVLKTNAINPVIATNPALARELILAAHIPEREVDRRYERDRYQPGGMTFDDSFQVPLYTRGPYLHLLRANSVEGLKLVVDLVNHYTERWAEWTRGDREVTIGEGANAQVWKGDQRLYFSYRGIYFTHSYVASALMALEKHLLDRLDKGESVEAEVDYLLANSRSLAIAGLLVAIGKRVPPLLFGKLWPLVTSPEIQVSEYPSIDHIRPEGGVSPTKREQVLLDEWNDLEVHKYALHEVCQNLVPYDDAQKKLAALAARWRELLNEPDKLQVDAFTLQKLAEIFDETNYTKTKLGDKERWEYQPPEKLLEIATERSKARRDDLLPLMTLPINCRTMLNNNEKLPDSKLDALFDQLDHLPNDAVLDDDRERAISSPADAQCAIVAVLVNLSDGWLDRHPDKAKRCGGLILKYIATSPAPQGSADQIGLGWENFAAEAVPYFLAQAPTDPEWRAAIAELANRPHLGTVRPLFRRATGVRQQLGELFPQLFHVVVWTGAARKVVDLDEFGKPPSLDWPKWWETKKAEFVAGNLSRLPDDWNMVDVGAGPGRHRDGRWGPKIKVEFIVAALDAISRAGYLSGKNEQAQFQDWIRKLLAVILTSLPTTISKRGNVKFPTDSEHHALILMGSHLAALKSAGERRAYWEPLLSRGAPAANYIKYFIQAFLAVGVRHPTEAFKQGWKEIVTWAETTPDWMFSGKEPTYEVRSLWPGLLALDGALGPALSTASPDIIAAMKTHYEVWARHSLGHQDGIQRFINFLRLPAAIGLLPDGVRWLDRSLESAQEKQWLFDHLASELSSFLQWVWSNHEKLIRSDADTFAGFRRLLMNTAAEQDQTALALLARITGPT